MHKRRLGRNQLDRSASINASVLDHSLRPYLAHTNKSLAQMNKSGDAVRATKGYQPEGDAGRSKEQAHFFHHRRVKRLSWIPTLLTRGPIPDPPQ